MKYHLCECGAVYVEQRGYNDAGRFDVTFYDLEGAVIDRCPVCEIDLRAQYGPSEAERQRENSLPVGMVTTRKDDDDLLR